MRNVPGTTTPPSSWGWHSCPLRYLATEERHPHWIHCHRRSPGMRRQHTNGDYRTCKTSLSQTLAEDGGQFLSISCGNGNNTVHNGNPKRILNTVRNTWKFHWIHCSTWKVSVRITIHDGGLRGWLNERNNFLPYFLKSLKCLLSN